MGETRDELIEQYPHLTPNDGKKDPLVLGAKNLRAELKHAGIAGLVSSARHAGGNSLNVSIADPAKIDEAHKIADKYRDRSWDSRTESYNYIESTWNDTFGATSHTSVQEAWSEDLQKIQGTYKAPPRKQLSIEEKTSRFITAVNRGTASNVARYVEDMKGQEGVIDRAWRLATQHVARSGFDQDVLGILVEKGGIDPNQETGGINPPTTALHLVVRRQEVVEVLLRHGADPNAVDGMGKTPLHIAAEAGSLGSVEQLLAKGVDLEARDRNGRTALHHVDAKTPNILDVLLAAGADPNAARADGKTPLFFARTVETAQALVDAGGDPSIQDDKGQTAVNWTVLPGRSAVPDDVKIVYQRQQLMELAKTRRAPDEDLATPEQALAARQARYGRMM